MSVYQILSIVGIPTLVSIVFGIIIKRPLERKVAENERQQEETQRQNSAVLAGMQALLRDRLVNGYKHYINKGFADYDDRANMENMYNQYHALGQNGVMDHLRQRFLALPIETTTEGEG